MRSVGTGPGGLSHAAADGVRRGRAPSQNVRVARERTGGELGRVGDSFRRDRPHGRARSAGGDDDCRTHKDNHARPSGQPHALTALRPRRGTAPDRRKVAGGGAQIRSDSPVPERNRLAERSGNAIVPGRAGRQTRRMREKMLDWIQTPGIPCGRIHGDVRHFDPASPIIPLGRPAMLSKPRTREGPARAEPGGQGVRGPVVRAGAARAPLLVRRRAPGRRAGSGPAAPPAGRVASR